MLNSCSHSLNNRLMYLVCFGYFISLYILVVVFCPYTLHYKSQLNCTHFKKAEQGAVNKIDQLVFYTIKHSIMIPTFEFRENYFQPSCKKFSFPLICSKFFILVNNFAV